MMTARRVLGVLFLVAIISLSYSSAISRKHRELPKLWKDVKNMPKEEVFAALKKLLTPEQKNALDDKIIEAIKNFIQKPEMDPYLVPLVNLDIQQDTIRVNGTLDTISATGISALQINKVHVNILLLKLDFEFTLPSLVIKGNYDIDGTSDDVLFLFGTGPFTVELSGAKASGTGYAGIGNGSIYVKSLDLNLGLEKVNVDIQNLMDDPELSDYLNEMINSIAPALLTEYKAWIEETASAWLIEFINGMLQGGSVYDIIS